MRRVYRVALFSAAFSALLVISVISRPRFLTPWAEAFVSSSTSFKIPISELISNSGPSSSTSFKLNSAGGQQATGISSSTSYKTWAGILYSIFGSAATTSITVAGTVYSDDGITTTTSTVALSINGGTKMTTSTTSGGAYIFTSVTQPVAADVMTVWMDNAGAGNGLGAAVTRYSSGNVSGLNIYKSQLITRHEDAGPLINTDIDACTKTLGAGCADSDLHFDVSGTALTVDNDWGLYLWEADTFTPGGTVTLSNGAAASAKGGDIKWASSTSAISLGNNALSVGGDFNNDAAASVSFGQTHITTFTATTTGFKINSGGAAFRNVVFNGSGGGWSAATSTLTIGAASVPGSLTMTAGTLNQSNGTSSVAVNGGSVTGSGGIINLTSASFTMTLTSTSSASFGSTSGDWTFNDLTFTNGSTSASTFRYTTQTSGTGNIAVGGNLSIVSSATVGNIMALDLGNRTWTLNGIDGTPIDITQSGGTVSFEPVSSTVVYAGANPSGNTTVASTTYYNLSSTGVDGYFLAASTTASGTVSISGGSTFDLNGGNLSAASLSVDSATFQGAADVLITGAVSFTGTAITGFTNPSTFEQRVSASSTLTVSIPASYTNLTFYNLKFNNTNAATSVISWVSGVPGSGLTVSNNLTIGDNSSSTVLLSGSASANAATINLIGGAPAAFAISAPRGSFNAGGHTMRVAGNLTFPGTFTASTSLVYFDANTTTSTISGTSTAELIFNDFKTDLPNKPLVFATSTQAYRINGVLTLTGASGTPILVDSNSSGTQWLINHQGTESVSFASVKDSGCVATSTFITSATTTDRGNNGTCWFAVSGITVSGTVFSDEGASTTTSTVKLAVGSSTSYSTSTDGSGVYSFANVTTPASGTILTVWMDNNGGGNGLGSTVTRATSTGNVTGLDIYKSRLITRHEDNGPLTNTNMSLCDKTTGSACADSDLHFEVTTSTSALAVDNDWALYLWGGKTFTPGGAVTLLNGSASSTAGGDLKWASSTSIISLAANALSIGGDWNNAASGTFTITSGQTTTFTASTTGFVITRPGTFENLTFNGSGGSWTFTTTGATTTIDLSVATGTLNIATSTLDVNGNMTIGMNGTFQASTTINLAKNLTSSGTFSVGSSTVVFDSTATSTITNSSTMNFWNFTSQTGAKPFVFGANQTFRVDGQLLVAGTSGSLISIDSTASGTQWLMNHQGTEAVSYVTVKDSGCVSTSTYISVSYADSVDRGNNAFCWLFPSLSFTISPLSVSLTLGDTNTFTSSATNTLTVTTNAGLGYNLTAYETALLTRTGATTTISNWTGTNATPTTWTTTCIASSSNCGFGYSTNDADLTQFSSTKFAGFTTSTPGDTVASAASQVTSDATVMTYRSSVDLSQSAGDYQTTIRYIIAPKF